MLARSALLRRLLQRATAVRTFHASVLSNDALDMADTFARRHSKFARHEQSSFDLGLQNGFCSMGICKLILSW
jgi:hypothetical protein